MARFGTNFDDVQGSYGGGAALPEPGVQDFEITAVKAGVQQKGNDVNAPYFSVRCAQVSGDAPGTRACSQFLGMGTKPWANGSCQKAMTKGFLEQIGRSDLLHANGEVEELIGTTFRARVYHDTDKQQRTQANLADIEPISHAQGAAANTPANAPANQPAQAQPVAQAPQQAAPPANPPAAAPATARRRAR